MTRKRFEKQRRHGDAVHRSGRTVWDVARISIRNELQSNGAVIRHVNLTLRSKVDGNATYRWSIPKSTKESECIVHDFSSNHEQSMLGDCKEEDENFKLAINFQGVKKSQILKCNFSYSVTKVAELLKAGFLRRKWSAEFHYKPLNKTQFLEFLFVLPDSSRLLEPLDHSFTDMKSLRNYKGRKEFILTEVNPGRNQVYSVEAEYETWQTKYLEILIPGGIALIASALIGLLLANETSTLTIIRVILVALIASILPFVFLKRLSKIAG